MQNNDADARNEHARRDREMTQTPINGSGFPTKVHRRGFIALVAAFPFAAHADPSLGEGWILLGESRVNLVKNFSIVPVTLAKGLFTGLVVEAVDKPIFIESIEVTFTNGETSELRVRSIISAGSRTRKMLLPGLVRGIRVVKIIYKRVPTGGTATVRIHGRRSGA
ncbi:hypothetical protein QKW60_12280 [Defluviimonas aestuarii]|uniref:hypothetical protein n=1 Tax=Albidovulum aestuarii TaxID=1130726 RepID=UPI00249C4160|nr:hypothetical protein [Defluviimonas aestuarii]MDI3337190.1 hypothetical protein [Defluviimonas aestuarii]